MGIEEEKGGTEVTLFRVFIHNDMYRHYDIHDGDL